jgi:hypothetical protein
MTGIAASASPASLGLVATIITTAPMNMKILRSATEAEEPKADLSSVVSAVRRDRSSPVFAVSKKAASSVVRCLNRSPRRSATTRSPSVMTK